MSSNKAFAIVGVVLFAGLIAACAGSTAIWGDVDSGLILEYRIPPKTVLSYSVESRSTENVEVMGQKMAVKTVSATHFSAATTAFADHVHDLNITLDSAYVNIASPRGELNGDMKNVIGKTFAMQLSSVGKEMNLKGTEEIEYELGPAGKRNATSAFAVIFPDMAGRPVKIGDTWTTKDTIRESGGGMEVVIIMEGQSRLDGLETFRGYECVRIVSPFTGKVQGKGSQGPMDLVTEGTMKGVDTTYFAYKGGFMVQAWTRGTLESVTEATGPQNMTIPSTRDMSIDIKLLKGPTPTKD